MAVMKDIKPDNNLGEIKTYECIEANLPKDIICYHNREIKGLQFDFCLLIKNIGMVVIEVKGWNAKDILDIKSPNEIIVSGFDKPLKSPKNQSRGYRFALLNYLNDSYNINPLVMDMVCYPFMSESEFRSKSLNIVSEAETTLFKEDIENAEKFTVKILNAYKQISQSTYDKMSKNVFETIRGVFENKKYISKEIETTSYSELRVYGKPMTLSDIDTVIKKYFLGVKEILFVQEKSELKMIAENLSNVFDQSNIQVSKGKLIYNKEAKNNITANNSFNLFNFEAYCVPEIEINENIVITNGREEQYPHIDFEKLLSKTGFNYNQYKVEHAPTDKHIQVRAGAGTGKTYSMISRISFLCNESSGSNILDVSKEIAMLTFTTDAAINMKVRLKSQFMNYFILTKNKKYLTKIDNIERMRISTIHSFANEIIKNTSLPLGIGKDFTTVSGQYQRRKIFSAVFNKYLEEKNKDDDTFLYNLPTNMYEFESKLLSFSTLLYNKGYDIKTASLEAFGEPDQQFPCFNELLEKVIKEADIEYSNFLFENNSVALNEYMIYLNQCIKNDDFNKNFYPYKYIFIDEFQDVDDSQIESFLEMEKKLKFKFFIVGDLKQSIYRFRGATMDAFSKIGSDESLWNRYSLNINYRSDKRLLEEYDNLFINMGKEKLIPYKEKEDSLIGIKETEKAENDEKLTQKVVYNREDEKSGELYEKLFTMIKERKTVLEERLSHGHLSDAERTIAILVRTNAEVVKILKYSKSHDVLVDSDSNGDLYRLQSTIDFCKLTSALANPYNPIYLFDLISSNNVNIAFPLEAIIDLDNNEKVKVMVDCLSQYYNRTMGCSWDELVKKVQSYPILMMLRKIYEATMPWKSDSPRIERQNYYRTNYELLFEELSRSNTRNYLTLDSINESLHIGIGIGTESKSRELSDARDGIKVVCTTVHKSKGLEYDSVFMPNTDRTIDTLHRNSLEVTYVDGKVGYLLNFKTPIQNSNFITENELRENMMEESRILYVAMTRAINRFVWFDNENASGETWGSILEEM